jgi:acetolactate synthase-1/2/3 large subunit
MKCASIKHFYDSSFNNFVNQENESHLQELLNDCLPLKPQKIFAEISRYLPEDATIISDIGSIGYFSLRNCKVYAMGQGVAGAIGAKFAAPDRTIISICGDGSFLMNGMEIATACSYNLSIIWFVFVDHRYGLVDQSQKLMFNELDFCTKFFTPDFSKLADAFALEYMRIKDLPSLHECLETVFKNNKTNRRFLIEIEYDTDEFLPIKPRIAKFIQDFGSPDSLQSNPYLMKAFKSMLREKV